MTRGLGLDNGQKLVKNANVYSAFDSARNKTSGSYFSKFRLIYEGTNRFFSRKKFLVNFHEISVSRIFNLSFFLFFGKFLTKYREIKRVFFSAELFYSGK